MAFSKHDDRMAFDCEQYDQYSLLTRYFVLLYYYQDGSVEMYQKKNNQIHLKRIKVPSLHTSDFFLGTTIDIFGIPTHITGCADEVTRQLCEKQNERTSILIAESSFESLGRYLSILMEECEFTIANLQMGEVTEDIVENYILPDALRGRRVVVVQTVRLGALLKGREFAVRAAETYAAEDPEQVFLWGKLAVLWGQVPIAEFDEPNCSVVLLKPHAISCRHAGYILQELINLDLAVSGLTQVFVNSDLINDFLSPYRGVLPDVPGTVQSLVGNVWIVQLISLENRFNVVEKVRKACGPYDSGVARKLFPNTIRAKFGVDGMRNAAHCCDLEEDGMVYTKTFFKLIAR
ncbi:unnamed protein product [Phytomonas sp. Hart1]|nr:unnamed protein product [Phytomonas sp. Hart1]|eukprot:CCW66495.1 unnamed protein product [Phytomonas sp. isolate Hart1]